MAAEIPGPEPRPSTEIAISRPAGKSLDPTSDANPVVLRPPVVGGLWVVKEPDLLVVTKAPLVKAPATTLLDTISDPAMPRQHTDKIGSTEDNTEFIGSAAVETVAPEPKNVALIFDLSLTHASDRIEEQAKRRGLVSGVDGISPAALLNGANPEQLADVVEKALHGEEGSIPERGIVQEVAGALSEHYERYATVAEVEAALRYLDRRPGAIDTTADDLKDRLNWIYGQGRAKIAEEGHFRTIIDLLTTFRDSEPTGEDAQPLPSNAQIVTFRMPVGEVGRQTELRALLGGRLPQIIGKQMEAGTPALLGVIDAHALPRPDLEAIADLSARNRVGHTIFGFNAARIPEDTRPFIGSNGTLDVSRVSPAVAPQISEIIGTKHGERQTGRSEDTSSSVTVSAGTNWSKTEGRDEGKSWSGKGKDKVPGGSKSKSKSETKGGSSDRSVGFTASQGASYEIGEIPRVEASVLTGLGPGDNIAYVPTAKGLDEREFNLAVHAAPGPQTPLDEQLAAKYPDIIAKAPTPQALPAGQSEVTGRRSKFTRAREAARAERARPAQEAAAARERMSFHARIVKSGLRFSDFVTPSGDTVAPQARTSDQIAVLTEFAAASPLARDGAIQELARREGVPNRVVQSVLAREAASREAYPAYVSGLEEYPTIVAQLAALKEQAETAKEKALPDVVEGTIVLDSDE